MAANFYPFKEAPRIASGASVVANGGRAEIFSVRLPEDRLGSARSAATAEYPQAAFAEDGKDKIVAELFRVRDAEGQVIGVASRLDGRVAASDAANEKGGARTSDWLLVIPSRGALMMSRGSVPVDDDGVASSDRMGLDAATSGIVVKGTDEFDGLTGFYAERTEVEKIDDAGVVHGVLTLDTRLRGGGA